MPRNDPKYQIEAFVTSDVFISPFGSNTANSIFMKPNSTFIEVSSLCSDLCTERCHPYSQTGPKKDNLIMATNMHGIKLNAACSSLMADGAPLHMFTGVNYYIIPACRSNLKCSSSKMYENGIELSGRKVWKRGFNDNFPFEKHLPKIKEILRGTDDDLRISPYLVRCPLHKE